MRDPDARRVFAPAKINLFLHVSDRGGDGYHALESLVAFADVGDELTIQPAEELSLTVDGPFANALAEEGDNLVLRAARGAAQLACREIPVRIALTKNLPVASGIGGGSADAAAVLRALLLDGEGGEVPGEIMLLAKTLGADVPVCLAGHSAWMSGIGEQVRPVTLPALHAVLVNPGIAVPTRDVFTALGPRSGVGAMHCPDSFDTARELIGFLTTVANDLETPALGLAPVIGAVLNALNAADGIALARMSGSGASCFGLFYDTASAQDAARDIARDYPDWWVKPTTLAARR